MTFPKHSKVAQFIVLLAVFILLCLSISPSESNFLWRLPPLLKQLPIIINDSVSHLLFDWMPIRVYDPVIDDYEGQTSFQRTDPNSFLVSFSWLLTLCERYFLGETRQSSPLPSWDFIAENPWANWPALPWTGNHRLGGDSWIQTARQRFGNIGGSMHDLCGDFRPVETINGNLIVCVDHRTVFRFAWADAGNPCAFRSRIVEAVLNPLLNIAQTMPHYSYLVPVIVLFGVGDHAAAIATIVFATPPMVRLTLLGLQKVPVDFVESGMMSGCGRFQLLFRVLVPTARRDILIGVNQVVMQCLAMTVIASFIGAQGLGSNLLIALNSLRVGTRDRNWCMHRSDCSFA